MITQLIVKGPEMSQNNLNSSSFLSTNTAIKSLLNFMLLEVYQTKIVYNLIYMICPGMIKKNTGYKAISKLIFHQELTMKDLKYMVASQLLLRTYLRNCHSLSAQYKSVSLNIQDWHSFSDPSNKTESIQQRTPLGLLEHILHTQSLSKIMGRQP